LELKPYLEELHGETHLALAAPTKESDLLDAVRQFSTTRIDRILFSKLDETSTYGTLLNVADRTGLPLSYITLGQRVPEDIAVADATALAELITD
jgi:flagellar biosynthesis protein FlhF